MKQWAKYLVYLLSTLLIFTSIPWQSVTAEENKMNGKSEKEVSESVLIKNQTSSVNGGEQEEIVSLRSETSKTYSNPDSTYTTEISEEPIHYKENEEDDWLPIDNTLVADAAEGTVVNKANSFKAEFNEQTTPNEAIVEVKQDEFSVSLTPVGPDEIVSDTVETNLETVEGVADENTIVYSDVYPNVDIKYTVGTDKVKEDIILKEKPKPNTPTSFSFVLDLNGLSYKVMENNQVMLLDKKTQEPVFYLEAPFMYDAYKPEGYKENPGVTSFSEETLSYDISMSVEQREDQLFIELVPNREWLDSEERVYPVVIDPTIAKFQPQAKLEDTNIRSHFPNNTGGAETTLGVGLYQDSAQTNNIRSLLKFDMSSIPTGTKVIDANLNMWLSSVWNDTKLSVDLHHATTNWTEGGATWLKRDGINAWNKSGGDYSSTLLSSADVSSLTDLSVNYKWSVPATNVQRWIHDSSTNKGLLLKANNETIKSWKKFVSSDDASLSKQTPMLAVTYISGSRLGLEDYWSYSDHDLVDAQGHVNLGTGNLVVGSTDFSLSGRGNSGFSFERTYNSKSIEHSAVGYGWSFSGSETITEYSNGNVLLQESDGTTHLFSYDKATSKYTAPIGKHLNLTKSTTAVFTLSDYSGNRAIYQNGKSDTYTDSVIYKIAYEEDRNKNRITYTRQTDGNLSSITDATGRILSFQYQNGRIVSTSFEGVKKSAYTYDTTGRLKTSTNFEDHSSTAGSLTTYQYNSEGSLSGIVDANGWVTKYIYEDSYLKSIEQPSIAGANSITNYDYSNLNTFTVKKSDANKNITTYKLNSNYMIEEEIDPMGYITSFDYDSNNNLLSRKDPKGNLTSNTYDSKGNILSSTDSLGNKTTYSYNNFSQPISITDSNGKLTNVYNAYGDLIKEINALGEVTSYSYYEPYGNIKSITDPAGSVQNYTYDVQGNYMNSAIDALNRQTSTIKDKYGNTTQSTDAMGNKTFYTYNEKNLLSSLKESNGKTTFYQYDGNGNLISIKNGKGNYVYFAYNSQNQFISRKESLGQNFRISYDAAGNQTTILKPNGVINETKYDANNRPISILSNNRLVWKHGYDQNGNLISTEDARYGSNTVFSYTKLDQLKTENNGQQLSEYSYSPTGQISEIQGNSKGTTFSQSYQYDSLDQITKILRNGIGQVELTYFNTGLLSERRFTNGVISSYNFDKGSQLVHLQTSRGTELITNEINEFDLNGNLTSVDSNLGNSKYSYDERNQLVRQELQSTKLTESYVYDGVGNRLSKTILKDGISKSISYSYDANNQLISVDNNIYTYDANGNRLSDEKYKYEYNEFDQLVRIKTISDIEVATYAYDELGRRISKIINGKITKYHYNQEIQVLYETDSSGNITAEYTYDAGGFPQTMTKNGQNYYYIYNSKGEISSLTNSLGTAVASYSYDAWGNILTQNGPMVNENPFKYTGYQYDEETGHYYLLARYYRASEGVFLTTDPEGGETGQPQLQNGYNYVSNNPLKYVDPDGRQESTEKPGSLPGGGIPVYALGTNIKHVYSSIKKAPTYPGYFKAIQNGTKKVTINDKKILAELRKVESGNWKKVYKDGYNFRRKKISIHYFESKSGQVFNVKVKTGWSTQ